jgi:O-antigen ligase
MAFWFSLWRSRQWLKGTAIILGVALVGFVAVMTLAPDTFLERMGGMGEYKEDESALGRLDAWGAGLRMLNEHPLFGVGAGAFSDAYGMRYKPTDAVAATWREAHSLYVQCFSELGLFGFFIVAGLVVVMFRDQRKISRFGVADAQLQRELHFFADALTAGLVGFLVSGAFLSVLYYPHLYILSTMSMILLRVTKDASVLTPKELADAH